MTQVQVTQVDSGTSGFESQFETQMTLCQAAKDACAKAIREGNFEQIATTKACYQLLLETRQDAFKQQKEMFKSILDHHENQKDKIKYGLHINHEELKEIKKTLDGVHHHLHQLDTSNEGCYIKLGFIEERMCNTDEEPNAASRFAQMAMMGERWGVSKTHKQALYETHFRHPKNPQANTYGFCMLENDERRIQMICALVQQYLENPEGCPLPADQDVSEMGALCHLCPAYREWFKEFETSDTGMEIPDKKIQWPEIPESLKALFKICQPLNKQCRPVDRKITPNN